MPKPWTRQKLTFWTVVWSVIAVMVGFVASVVYVMAHFVAKFW